MKARRRRRNRSLTFVFVTWSAIATASAWAQPAVITPPTPDGVRERWLSRLDGRHFTATIVLTLERGGKTELRRLLVWRDDEGSRRERVMARFDEPPDKRGLGVLYIQNPDRGNDYFLYQPATRRVRRIAEALAREDVYGLDLEYLAFGLAQREPTRVESMAPESLAGRATLRLTETALQANPRFDRRTTWIDPETFIPVESVHYRGDRESLRARTVEVRTIQGVPTPIRIVFDRPATHETVTMTVAQIDYDAPIPQQYFSTMALTKQR